MAARLTPELLKLLLEPTKPTTLTELLGAQLLQHNESEKESNYISTNQLDGKAVALYFAAQSCPTCRNFTQKLVEAFKNVNNQVKDDLDIVFISSDEDQAEFDAHFKEMPWKALPWFERDRSKTLKETFYVERIPSLIAISSTCEVITSDGVNDASNDALLRWSQEKYLYWSREARDGEYIWKDLTCSQCFMRPLTGPRYNCIDGCVDLCDTCLPNYKHEHPVFEHLAHTKHTLQEYFKSVPYLLNPNNDKIETNTLWEDNVKFVGMYRSATDCSPCKKFTPKLAEVYKEASEISESFRIVYLSCDGDEDEFNESRSTMPWPAIPFHSRYSLAEYFHELSIPNLVIILSDGKILKTCGVHDVSRKGVEAFQAWLYHCRTCGDYYSCSACEKKGHEHSLDRFEQLTYDGGS